MAVFDDNGLCLTCHRPKAEHDRDIMWEEWDCPAEVLEKGKPCCCGKKKIIPAEGFADAIIYNDIQHEVLGPPGNFCGPKWKHEIRDLQRENEKLRESHTMAQAKADVIGGEFCKEARAAGRNPCGACVLCVKDAEKRYDDLREASRRALSKLDADIKACYQGDYVNEIGVDLAFSRFQQTMRFLVKE